jgi:predicted Fe-Mo cluster-binding NifX family protein
VSSSCNLGTKSGLKKSDMCPKCPAKAELQYSISHKLKANSKVPFLPATGCRKAKYPRDIIANKGVELVITGNCGPNAFQVLSAAGIKVVTGVSGEVRDTVHDYKAGSL